MFLVHVWSHHSSAQGTWETGGTPAGEGLGLPIGPVYIVMWEVVLRKEFSQDELLAQYIPIIILISF